MNGIGMNYVQRLETVRTKAKALESAPPQEYSDYVAKELYDSAKGAPTPQTAVYVRMMHGLTAKCADLPVLQKELWSVALQVASQGVPGSAGVALAKTVQQVDDNHVFGRMQGPWNYSIGRDLEEDTAKFCAHSMGQTSQDSINIANKALHDANRYSNPVYIANGIQDIAALEQWRIPS